MQNDYAPVELEEVEEEEVENEVVQQCENDTKLKWDCDSRYNIEHTNYISK